MFPYTFVEMLTLMMINHIMRQLPICMSEYMCVVSGTSGALSTSVREGGGSYSKPPLFLPLHTHTQSLTHSHTPCFGHK